MSVNDSSNNNKDDDPPRPPPPPPPIQSANNNPNVHPKKGNYEEPSVFDFVNPNKARNAVKRFLSTRDDMRVARLKQCQVLQQVLQECRDRQAQNNTPSLGKEQQQQPKRTQLEEFPMGIRSVRFFDWRDIRPDDPNSCIREEHAVWACRSVGVKCGGEMVHLRDCFRELSVDTVLNSSQQTAYESIRNASSPDQDQIPCRSLQWSLGQCIRKNTKALEERMRSREERRSKDYLQQQQGESE